MTIPVFETPELPREERVKILKRCHDVEIEVKKNTVYRMFKHYPLSKPLIKHFFNVDLFERLYFKNLFFRKLFEWIRYKKSIKS
jgi:hypothetical protein